MGEARGERRPNYTGRRCIGQVQPRCELGRELAVACRLSKGVPTPTLSEDSLLNFHLPAYLTSYSGHRAEHHGDRKREIRCLRSVRNDDIPEVLRALSNILHVATRRAQRTAKRRQSEDQSV